MKIAIWHNLPSDGGKRALFYHVWGLVDSLSPQGFGGSYR